MHLPRLTCCRQFPSRRCRCPLGLRLHPPCARCSYVYINGRLVGGCDATKALIASGEFDTLLGGGGGKLIDSAS